MALIFRCLGWSTTAYSEDTCCGYPNVADEGCERQLTLKTLITGNRLFDGVRRSLMENPSIIVEDGTIVEISDSPLNREVDNSVNLGDVTFLPGLIDGHDHLAIDMGDGTEEAEAPLAWRALKAARNLEAMLRSGITTLRCPGETFDLGFIVQRALHAGIVRGPNLILAGQPITATGGHGWFLAREADGPVAVRTAVRAQAKAGADFIKIIITGGATTLGSHLSAGCMTEQEIDAAIDEAHRLGKPIAAHAYGGRVATHAIQAGIDSIEHGTFLTDDDLDQMAQRGTFLVSTAGVMRAGGDPTRVRPFMAHQFARVNEAYVQLLRRARERDIRVVVGNDTHHAHLDDELAILCEAGYTPTEALTAATSRAAELCQIADITGSIEVGKSADIIAVRGNPLEDITVIREVVLVMKRGVVEIDEHSETIGGEGPVIARYS